MAGIDLQLQLLVRRIPGTPVAGASTGGLGGRQNWMAPVCLGDPAGFTGVGGGIGGLGDLGHRGHSPLVRVCDNIDLAAAGRASLPSALEVAPFTDEVTGPAEAA